MTHTYTDYTYLLDQIWTVEPCHFAIYALHHRPHLESAADDHFSTHTTIAGSLGSKVKRKASSASIKTIKHYRRIEGRLDASAKKHKEKRRQRVRTFRALVGFKTRTKITPVGSVSEVKRKGC